MRIVHVVGFLGNGGDTSAIMNIYDYIKKNKLPYKFDFITHKGCDLKFVKKVEEMGSKVFILDGDVRKQGFFKYYKNIKKILKENKYDAIHFHTSFQSFVGLIAAKKEKIKIRICHSHTSQMQRKLNFILKSIIVPISKFFISKYSTKMVACSEVAAKNLFLRDKNYTIVYNGIDIKKIKTINKENVEKIKEKYNIKKTDICIGQVGRLSEMKNPLFTLKLASKLDEKYKFFFLGDGDLLDICKDYVEKNGINNVYFTGKVNNANEYMSMFDFLILPSKYGEGLPVVLTECQIINPNCICLANSNVSREANLGNVYYYSISDYKLWIDEIKKKHTSSRIDYKKFDLNNTAEEWIKLYK